MIEFKSQDQKASIQKVSEREIASAYEKVLIDPQAGFLQVLKDSTWLTEIKSALKSLKTTDKIGIVGTGGSVLGSQALFDSLVPDQKRLFFLVNNEEWFFQNCVQNESPENIFWILISKSGGTFETQAYIERLMEWSEHCKRPICERAIVITQKNQNELHLWALENKIPIVDVPENLSGRYSVVSPVGMVPALAMGLDVEAIVRGGLKQVSAKEAILNACQSLFLSFDRGEWITTQFCYSLKLRRLGDWWVQLWSESLAKKDGARVSTPMVSVGSIDQHSQLQQFMEGERDKYFIFVSYCSSQQRKLTGKHFKFFKSLKSFSLYDLLNGQLQGTKNAFSQSQISYAEIEISKLTEESLGAYFLFWEMVVATMAQVLKINAYNQPGVELGKRLASDILLNPKVEPGRRRT